MNTENIIKRRNGKNAVKIKTDRYGTEVLTTMDGRQWTGFMVNHDLLKLLQEAIQEYSHNLVIDANQNDQEVNVSA